MTETPRKQRLVLGCLALVAAGAAGAEVFTHKNQAENFEAVVTADRLIVKERYQGATTIYGDLTCPLGPAVNALVLPLASDGRLCLQFSKEKCKYTRFQDGEPIHGEELKAPKPRMCIALATAQDAQRFATVVNAGPQPAQQPAVGSTGTGATQTAPVAETVTPGPSRNDSATSAERPPPTKAPLPAPVAKVEVAPARPAAAPPVEQTEPEAKSATSPTPGQRSTPAARRDDEEKKAPLNVQIERRDESEKKTTAGRPAPTPQTSPAVPSAKGPGHINTDAPSGRWVTESFVVGPEGNRRMAERTYATAFVGQNAPGKPPGEYLYIRNKSDKHLLFYSLGSGPQMRLEPGTQTVMALGLERSGSRIEKQKSVTLLWFDAIASGAMRRYR